MVNLKNNTVFIVTNNNQIIGVFSELRYVRESILNTHSAQSGNPTIVFDSFDTVRVQDGTEYKIHKAIVKSAPDHF